MLTPLDFFKDVLDEAVNCVLVWLFDFTDFFYVFVIRTHNSIGITACLVILVYYRT